MSRAVGWGRLLFEEAEVVVVEGRERMVKEVKRGMGRILKVFVFVGAGVEAEVVELETAFDGEDDGGMERTMRLVIGSAV